MVVVVVAQCGCVPKNEPTLFSVASIGIQSRYVRRSTRNMAILCRQPRVRARPFAATLYLAPARTTL